MCTAKGPVGEAASCGCWRGWGDHALPALMSRARSGSAANLEAAESLYRRLRLEIAGGKIG